MTDSASSIQHPASDIQHLPRFFVKQRFTMMVNRYEVRMAGADGAPGQLLAIAQQKRLAMKERVTFFADEARTTPVFSFAARNVLDLAAAYDVVDADGTQIGSFQKDFGASLLRSSFHLRAAGIDAYGQERNQVVAILRRFMDFPFSFHFDFKDKTDGHAVMSSDRQFTLRDRYSVEVPDSRVDYRLAAAMAVGLDALLRR